MSVEVEEVTGFLAGHEPFSHLPPADLAAISASMTMRYIRRGTTIITSGQRNDTLHVIRSGAVDVLDSDGGLLDRREPGLSVFTLCKPGRSAVRPRSLPTTLPRVCCAPLCAMS